MDSARIAIAGLGHVGKAFVALLQQFPYLKLVGVSDSSGVLLDPKGLRPIEVLANKTAGKRLSPGALWEAKPDILINATPSRYDDVGCALPVIEALDRGVHCVLASKGPLVCDWPALKIRSDFHAPTLPALRFGAAIGAAIPSFNIARREFQGTQIDRIEGILNITSQRVLSLMQQGLSMEVALRQLTADGIAEKSPKSDLDGTDAAAKLLILSNALWDTQLSMHDVKRQGMSEISTALLDEARRAQRQIALIATAEKREPSVQLQVAPVIMDRHHPLHRVMSTEQAVVFYSRLHGRLTVIGESLGPEGTAASLLRDVLEVCTHR